VSNYCSPFQKWNKDKITKLINDTNFTFTSENGGIFQFYYKVNDFQHSYILYLQRTRMSIDRIGIGITSYSKLKEVLEKEIQKYN